MLETLSKDGTIENSRDFASKHNLDYEQFVGVLKSLEFGAQKLIKTTVKEATVISLTKEAQGIVKNGATPEVKVFNIIPTSGSILKSEITKKLGPQASIGYGKAMSNKWIEQIKSGDGKDFLVKRAVSTVIDTVYEQLKQIHAGEANKLSKNAIDVLKKRKLVSSDIVKYFTIEKGEEFTLERKKMQTDLTAEILQSGEWRNETFKPYNFAAQGKKNPWNGHLHPLLKVRTEFRKIFLEMGFEEMQTNNFVESSFWNFDALFQPQQHPARDAHDTFFLSRPANCHSIPEEFLKKVKDVHEKGGYGSIGYRYDWKTEEAQKNLLRTHTTAVSSRYLYNIAQELKQKGEFKPRKFFSIDRVFRNEVPDATHLCEFHQIEGMVIDKNLSLGDLIGLLSTFFGKVGIHQLKFKPAYNPYTEPSMEIFGYHPQLGRWVEIGNSGMFRPEMLRPMGLPEDVVVIAWGLSLERPTMIMYEIDNIRNLVGHKVPLKMIYTYPFCRLDKQKSSSKKDSAKE